MTDKIYGKCDRSQVGQQRVTPLGRKSELKVLLWNSVFRNIDYHVESNYINEINSYLFLFKHINGQWYILVMHNIQQTDNSGIVSIFHCKLRQGKRLFTKEKKIGSLFAP